MSKSTILQVLTVLLILICFTHCQKPMDILGRDKMLDVTRDMLLTEAYLRNHYEPDSVAQQLYESVLDKHGVSKAKYDSSFVWYNERPHRLDKIYEKLEKEFAENKLLLDTLYIDSIDMQRIRFTPMESLWRGPNRLLVHPLQPSFYYDQDINIESEFEPNDTIEWYASSRPLAESDSLNIRLQLRIMDGDGHYYTRLTSIAAPDSLHSLRHLIYLPDSIPFGAMATIHFWIIKPKTRLFLDHFYLGKKVPPAPIEEPSEEEDEPIEEETVEQQEEMVEKESIHDME